MTTPSLLSSLVLTGLLLTSAIASADSATRRRPAEPASESPPLAGTTKPGANGTGTTGTLRTSKTSLGLRIDYAFDTPATGRTTEVRLKVEGNEAGRPLQIEVVPGSGLQMARGLPGNIAMQSTPSAEHVLAITPTGDGLHYLHVFLRSGGMTEALAIAVPTGKGQSLTQPAATKTTPDGRRVKSIPAQQ